MVARVSHRWRARALLCVCAAGGVLVIAAGFGYGRPSRTTLEATPNEVQLFDRACARCHGTDGGGGLPMAAGGPRPIDLREADWQVSRSDEELSAVIRDGRGAMPPFRDVLTPSEIGALTRHVRRLAGHSPR